jgi:hypothetical protein
MLAGLGHDPLLRDVFAPVCTGAVLCIPSPGLRRAPRELLAWLAAERVTIAHVTPPLIRLLGAAAGTLPDLRLVMCGGDQLRGADVELLRDLAPQATIVNAYGTTATPQVMAWHVVEPGDPAGDRNAPVPVGRGIDGVDMLVLDARGRTAAIGEVGRVSVSTPYLTRGLRAPYCTGDLGRHGPDGSVVVLGRADDRVSVAGHSIMPAEIDSVVARQPYVLDSVTLARPGPDRELRLVTYLVSRGDAPTLARLRRDLRRDLPTHLLPSVLVVVDRLPLSPNGKVDLLALPQPGTTADLATNAAIAPRTELERRVADVWRAVLRVDTAGVDVSFFDLGGTSILMAQVQQRLELMLRREIPIVSLFTYPTIRMLAAFLASPGTDPLDGLRTGLIPVAPDARRRRAVRRMVGRELQLQMRESHDD